MYGKSNACVFLRMLLQVRSARAGETSVMENRLKEPRNALNVRAENFYECVVN